MSETNTTETAALPPLEIERWPTSRLIKHPRNYNKHPIDQVEQLAASLRSRGFRKPIVVQRSTGFVVAGNGIFAAALHLGLPEVYVAPWDCSDEEALKYLVADNELARMSSADQKGLDGILGDLAARASSLEALVSEGLGFKFDDLKIRVDGDDKKRRKKGDRTPPTPKVAKTKPGTLYALGAHRLLCGDSTTPEAFQLVMAGQKADMVFTDHPYGVSYKDAKGTGLAGDDLRDDELVNRLLLPSLKHMRAASRPTAAFYLWHAEDTAEDFRRAIAQAGLRRLETIIWAKPTGGLGTQDYRRSHEPCFYCCRDGEKPAFYGDRTGTSVWRIAVIEDTDETATVLGPGLRILDGSGRQIFLQPTRPKGGRGRKLRVEKGDVLLVQVDEPTSTVWEVKRDSRYEHPTQKPTALAERAIANSSEHGGIVLDPFGGSGSTLIAAEETGRSARLIELDPKFCDVIVERWEKRTRRKAEVINNPED